MKRFISPAAAVVFSLALLAPAPLGLAQAGGANGNSVEDAEYGVRLRAPGSDWYVLSKQSAKVIAPTAIAAVAHETGLVGFIAVDKALSSDPEKAARDFVNLNRFEARRIESFTPTEIDGRRAYRAVVTGLFQNRPYRAEYLLWFERGLFYQLVANGPTDVVDVAKFRAVFDSFELLSGGPRPGAGTVTAADAIGHTWRVRDGVFEDAAFGLAIEPRGTWRLAVGRELAALNEGALAGLVCLKPPAYVTFVPEKVPQLVQKAHADVFRQGMARQAAPVTGVSFPATMGGETIVLDRYAEAGGRDGHIFSGVLYRGDVAFQVTAVLRAKPDSSALNALSEALSGVRFLGEADKAAVARDIEAHGDRESLVGPDYSLRGDVYRDFEHGFSWKRPSRAFTMRRLDSSEGPPATVTLEFEAPALGVFGLVVGEDGSSRSGAEYHKATVADMFGKAGEPTRHEPSEVRLGEANGLLSFGDRKTDGLPSRCYVATAVAGTRGFHVMVYGLLENMNAASAEVEAAIRGLEVAVNGLPPFEATASSIRESRLGFELRCPGSDWRFQRSDNDELNETGGAAGWMHEGDAGLVVVVKTLTDDRLLDELDAEAFLQNLPELALQHFGTQPSETRTTIWGRECRQWTWESGRKRLDVFVLRRGATYMALVFVPYDGRPTVEEAKALLTLLP